MSKQDNGGAAFPRPVGVSAGSHNHRNEHAIRCDEGMTLLDYFIAHAPAEPQPWFQPVMPEPCPLPPPYVTNLTEAERHESNSLGEYLGLEDLKEPRIIAYYTAKLAADKAARVWRGEAEKQRYVQWPAAWADEQLKARAQ